MAEAHDPATESTSSTGEPAEPTGTATFGTPLERHQELATLMWMGRDTFLSSSTTFHWKPAPGSQAALDQAVLEKFDPNEFMDGIWAGFHLVSEVVATYLSIGGGHLAAMAVLFETGEVHFAPKPLARSTIENCARAMWVLGKPSDAAEQRLARAYLEELLSSEIAKRTAGHLGEKTDPVHQDAQKRWKEVRRRMIAAYPGADATSISKGELGDQVRPGVEDGVTWFYALLRDHAGGNLSDDQASGMYDFLSSGTHPTLYQARQMRHWDEDHGDHVSSLFVVDTEFLERLCTAAVVAYFQVLAATFSYFGADPTPVEKFADAIERVLPGVLKPAASAT
ncbi:hypothetical protein OO014_03420 [Intrasporangium calvum]|uniref:Uncharacterized protein n=1 Tax=Intrasporangium calvum TaxID=53358 RepID=A0ABT5GDH7_9MICO|nr:hypothetical protein [Intrasporangium calvum]MDC5696293.1 hypothetical protein [Intrasporangium calvum]